MKADSEEKARAMLERYSALDKELPVRKIQSGNMTINDPYNGLVRVSWHEEHIWGGVGQGEEMEALIKDLGTNLVGKQEK